MPTKREVKKINSAKKSHLQLIVFYFFVNTNKTLYNR